MPQQDALLSADRTLTLVRRAITLAVEASPASLEECTLALRQVYEELLDWRRMPAVRLPNEALFELRRQTGRLAAVLEHAAGFYQGWVRVRNALTAGYSCHGTPAEANPEPRLRLEA